MVSRRSRGSLTHSSCRPSPYHFAYVPVMVDGRGLNLIADTGASTTYINQAQLGLSEADAKADRTILARSSGPDSLDVHVHRFHSAQIGSVSFEDVSFAIGPISSRRRRTAGK